MICETPMCSCAPAGHCPKERRSRIDAMQDALHDMAEALAKCEEHREECGKCHPVMLCIVGIVLEKDAKEIALRLVGAAARGE